MSDLAGEGGREEQVRMLLRVLEEEQRCAATGHDERSLIDDLEIPEIDLRTVVGELTALKAAVKAEATASRELRERFSELFDSVRDELHRAREREARIEAEWSERLSTVGRRAALDLIELVDRLEPAIERARDLSRRRSSWLPWRRTNPAVAALLEGLELTLNRLVRRLGERGVRRIPTARAPFDPRTMEAVERVERRDIDDGVVVREVTAGYLQAATKGNDDADKEVVRVAQVVVNRNPERSEA